MDVQAEMIVVERVLTDLGYERAKGSAQRPPPKITIVDDMPSASMLSVGLNEIAIRRYPEACQELRLQYELTNLVMLTRYGDASEHAAKQVAIHYEPWSPNCVRTTNE